MGNQITIEDLNIFCCSVSGQVREVLMNKLFTERKTDLIRELNNEEMHYKAKIYNNTETMINDIKANIKIFKFNNIILCFDGNNNIQSHLDYWNNLVNIIRAKHVDINNLPHIIFLNPFGDNIDLNNQFLNYEDKRTITILNVLRNTSEDSIETNYRLIFSLLWEKNLHFNQMKIKSSKNFNANLFRFNVEPSNSIKILLTGFSRCGKSTFINLIFNKLFSRESLSPLPVTKNSIEYFYCLDQPHKVKDNGLILIDSPGVLGTSDNQNLIKEIINNAIANSNETLDNINYILFFYSATQTFQYTEQFLLFLNGLSIPVLFIITHSPIEDHSYKESLLNFLNLKKFNNLIEGEEGNNIFEVDLKNKDEGRINKIFKYMYNDLIQKNAFLTNNQMIEDKAKKEEIENFIRDLNKKSKLFNKIKGINDIVQRGRKKANVAIASFISSITATGFSPIPLVDIPLFFIFLATMLICIISSYQIKLKSVNYSDFFSFIFENNKAGDLLSESHNDLKNLKTEERKKVSTINKMILRFSGGTVALFAITIVKIVLIRLIILGASEVLDFIPVFGFIVGGVVAAVVNIPLAKKLSKNSKKYCEKLVKERIGDVVNNIIEGYKNSVDIIKILSERNDWERKVLVMDKI